MVVTVTDRTRTIANGVTARIVQDVVTERGKPVEVTANWYREEYYRGQAEDRARVLSRSEQVEVPFGHFPKGRVLMIKDMNPLEPKALEYKFFARGVGPVLSVGVSGGSDREELVSFRRGRWAAGD